MPGVRSRAVFYCSAATACTRNSAGFALVASPVGQHPVLTSLPGCGAEVAQKKVARKPREHTFFLLRFWRAHRMKCVLGLVVTAMLLLFVSGISMGNIEKSARQMAKEMETERREASAEQAKRRSGPAPCGLAPLPGQCA